MKQHKAILIDSKNKTISAVNVDESVDAYNKLIGSSCYTGGPRLANRDGVLVDDEGLMNLTEESTFFLFDGYPQPLAGNGLMLGCRPNGETASVKSSIDEIAARVTFLTLAEVQAGAAQGKW